MKYLKYTRLLCMALLAMGFTACNDEDALSLIHISEPTRPY